MDGRGNGDQVISPRFLLQNGKASKARSFTLPSPFNTVSRPFKRKASFFTDLHPKPGPLRLFLFKSVSETDSGKFREVQAIFEFNWFKIDFASIVLWLLCWNNYLIHVLWEWNGSNETTVRVICLTNFLRDCSVMSTVVPGLHSVYGYWGLLSQPYWTFGPV